MVTTIKITCDGVCIQSNSFLTNLHLNGNIRNSGKESGNCPVSHKSSPNNVDEIDKANGHDAEESVREIKDQNSKKNRSVRANYSTENFPPKAHVYFVRRLSIVSPEDFSHKVIKEPAEKSTVASNLGQ